MLKLVKVGVPGKESPSTVCLARIEGLMKSALTAAVNHFGKLQEGLRGLRGLI